MRDVQKQHCDLYKGSIISLGYSKNPYSRFSNSSDIFLACITAPSSAIRLSNLSSAATRMTSCSSFGRDDSARAAWTMLVDISEVGLEADPTSAEMIGKMTFLCRFSISTSVKRRGLMDSARCTGFRVTSSMKWGMGDKSFRSDPIHSATHIREEERLKVPSPRIRGKVFIFDSRGSTTSKLEYTIPTYATENGHGVPEDDLEGKGIGQVKSSENGRFPSVDQGIETSCIASSMPVDAMGRAGMHA